MAPAPDSPSDISLKIVTECMASACITPSVTAAPQSSAAACSQSEVHTASYITAVLQDMYVDAHTLSAEYVHHLDVRFLMSRGEVSPGKVVVRRVEPEDVTLSRDFTSFSSGMVQYLNLVRVHRPSRLDDVLAWWGKLLQERSLSPGDKVVYAKEFMYTYKGCVDWVA